MKTLLRLFSIPLLFLISFTVQAGLVLHYDFENDSSNAGTLGDTHDGSIFGDAFYSQGVDTGSSLNLGTDGYMTIPNLILGDLITIAAWVNIGPGDTSIQTITSTRHSGGGARGVFFYVNHWNTNPGDRRLELETSDGSGGNPGPYDTARTPHAVVGDDWHHVTLTMDRLTKDVQFFVDAVEILKQLSSFDDLFTDNLSITIGQVTPTLNMGRFVGSIDDYRVYDTVLNQSEISNIVNGAQVPEPRMLFLILFFFLSMLAWKHNMKEKDKGSFPGIA